MPKSKKLRPSSTPGRSKGWNCRASPQDRSFARNSRSYKHPNYSSWKKQGSKEPGVRA